MRNRIHSLGRSLAAVVTAIGVALLLADRATAQPEIGPNIAATWIVQPAFGQGGDGRDNVSGLACLKVPPGRDCLVVNDGVKFAQLFSITGTAIHPGATVGFKSPAQSALLGTPNAEGAAHDGSSFYLVTSRGRSELPGLTDSSFLIFRFRLDAAGQPVLEPGGGMEVTDRVRTALTAGIPVPDSPGEKIDATNAQIEGIAIRNGVVHLGLRTPVLGGKSFILSMTVQALFRGVGPLNPTVSALALGPDTAIHDLATITDGILILTGPGRILLGRPTVFLWDEATGILKTLARLTEPVDRSAEGMLVIDDDAEFLRLLVMFDGVPNGGPIEYFIPR